MGMGWTAATELVKREIGHDSVASTSTR